MIEFLMNREADIMRRYRRDMYKTKIAMRNAIEDLLNEMVLNYEEIETLEELNWVCKSINCWNSILRSEFHVYRYIPLPSSKEVNLSGGYTEPLQSLSHYPAAAMFGSLNIEALRQEYGDPPFL